MAKLVGKRYAEALYEVAIELDKLEEFKKEINAVADVFNKNPRLETIFTHPRITKAEKKDMVDKLFKDRVSNEILNLCYIVVDKRREKYLDDISKSYKDLSNDKLGIVEADAYTAVPMTEDEINKLQQKLSSSFKKTVELNTHIDKDIMGGVLVKVGDKVIDGSVKGKLREIQKELNNIRLTAE